MTEPEREEVPSEATGQLVANFHNVRNLVPVDQELLTVPPEMSVADALKLMLTNHYSQLPVVAGGAVLGVFSYRSFSSRAIARMRVTDESLGDLPVEDFLDDVDYAHSTQDWNRVLRYLNHDDGFLVGHRDGLEGLVTTMDVLDYYREIADPFIMIAEIELSLRRIIETCVGQDALPDAIARSLSSAYRSDRIPTALNHMTFNNFVRIITNGENWVYFERMFGGGERTRQRTSDRLGQINDWRNTIFHFRRRLEKWELDTLVEYREWLQRRVRAFEGRKRTPVKGPDVPTSATPSRGRTNQDEMLAACTPEAVPFIRWLLSEAVAHNLVTTWRATGFTLRIELPDRVASFAYVDIPGTFQIYLHNALRLSKAEALQWRQELMAFGILQPKGDKTFQVEIDAANTPLLQKLFAYLLGSVVALARYPLEIQAVVDGKTIIAELLDESGRILFDGAEFGSVSAAAKAATGRTSPNGWTFWQYYNERARAWRPIDELRQH